MGALAGGERRAAIGLIPLVSSVLALLLYGWTLAPGLTWAHFGADGGELITASFTLGVPHPPGYPTYVALGKLFSYLPLGSTAVRYNLFSAAAAAAAAAFVSAAALSLMDQPQPSPAEAAAATAAGISLAAAPLVWGQATIAEVYALNLMVLAALLWSLLSEKPPLLTGALLGLSVSTHLTSLLMVPLVLALTPGASWGRLGAGVLFGLTPYLLIPLFAAGDSPIVWGEPTSPAGWLWLVSGSLYRSNLFSLPGAELWPRLQSWLPMLAAQLSWAALVLLLFSFLGTAAQRRRRWLLMGATGAAYLVYAVGYNSVDAAVFTLPALLLGALMMVPGLRALRWAALLLPISVIVINYQGMDLSGDTTVREAAQLMLPAAPADAILLTPGDRTIFALWYYHHVEGQRPDVVLVDSNLFAFDWYRQRLGRLNPDLGGLERDDLPAFQQANRHRPICHVTVDQADLDLSSDHTCIEASN